MTVGSVTPQPGTTVVGWSLTAREQGAAPETARTLATGNGSPTGQAPLALTRSASLSGSPLTTFDPTVLPNGIWLLQLTLVDSAGGRSRTQVAVVVDGQLKLGDAELSYQDMSVPVGGIPIQVIRRYRSVERSRDGSSGTAGHWRPAASGSRSTVRSVTAGGSSTGAGRA